MQGTFEAFEPVLAGLLLFGVVACSTQDETLGLRVTPIQATIQPNGSQLFSGSVMDTDGEAQDDLTLSWVSSNLEIATINEAGLATAVKEGTVEIMASIGETSASAILQVSTKRPPEITNVAPFEGEAVDLTPCLSEPCPARPSLASVGASFSFPGEDILESARLLLDGVEVASDSDIVFTGASEGDEASIGYSHLLELPVGYHQATVKAISQAEKSVTYTWSFTIFIADPKN